MWLAVILTKPCKETEAEAQLVKEVFSGATKMEDTVHQVLEKHGFWQTIRITSWVARFIQNSKKGKKYLLSGTLTTCETDKQVKFLVGRAQNSRLNTNKFQEISSKLICRRMKRLCTSAEEESGEASLFTYHQMPC